jgi:ribonucleoside-diphosphate reductase beta chain
VLAGYGHFLRAAASRQWDETAIDLVSDARAWPKLDRSRRDRVGRLVAGFRLGERSVAAHLEPYAAAAEDPDAAACFEIQAVDEARHARFFERVGREVLGDPDERVTSAPAALRELFERRLPASARALAQGSEQLEAAVGLYHMVLEGVVFGAGQLALIELLDGVASLPGLRRGTELVVRDEQWHLGFGARCLGDLRPSAETVRTILAEGERAAGAWGDAVGPSLTTQVRTLHRRRLRAAGLVLEALAAG